MTLFGTLLGDPAVRHAVSTLSLIALVTALAAVVWLRSRRAAACRPLHHVGRHMVEHRAWDFCPVCGWRRPADARGPSPDAATAPIRDAITQVGTSTTDNRLLPSALLHKGWTRQAALDAEGRIVTPCHPTATAYSIWGAGDRTFEPGSEPWRNWIRHLTDILDERHGGVSMQHWNREPRRTHSKIVAVAVEIERRMGLGPHPHDRRNRSERTTA